MTHNVLNRFLKYVVIDTQSDPLSTSNPSTEKQKNLGRILVEELLELGLADAHLDEWGYVYATLPSNLAKKVPVICFCSHIDTSPDSSGTNVKPIIHKNYRGQDLVLPDDSSIIIREKDHPDLKNQHGNDVITASGTTLLGADNKAGLAAIMDAVDILTKNPSIPHGTIKILFTPDEEVGRGTEKVDLKKLGAKFGYTIDGETAGSIEDETFSADGATITIRGVSAHPGFAKGKMENAVRIAAEIVAKLPKAKSPEQTSGRQGFIHPGSVESGLESATIRLILRDFTNEKLAAHGHLLRKIVADVLKNYPNSTAEIHIFEQYRNMKLILKKHPKVVKNAVEALKRAGFSPIQGSIRGGTDGSRLSFMGLPCPNIFAGEHAFHSKYEWVSRQDMEKAAETIVHLAEIWSE
jgi:tripeptide aminopeptidase